MYRNCFTAAVFLLLSVSGVSAAGLTVDTGHISVDEQGGVSVHAGGASSSQETESQEDRQIREIISKDKADKIEALGNRPSEKAKSSVCGKALYCLNNGKAVSSLPLPKEVTD